MSQETPKFSKSGLGVPGTSIAKDGNEDDKSIIINDRSDKLEPNLLTQSIPATPKDSPNRTPITKILKTKNPSTTGNNLSMRSRQVLDHYLLGNKLMRSQSNRIINKKPSPRQIMKISCSKSDQSEGTNQMDNKHQAKLDLNLTSNLKRMSDSDFPYPSGRVSKSKFNCYCKYGCLYCLVCLVSFCLPAKLKRGSMI